MFHWNRRGVALALSFLSLSSVHLVLERAPRAHLVIHCPRITLNGRSQVLRRRPKIENGINASEESATTSSRLIALSFANNLLCLLLSMHSLFSISPSLFLSLGIRFVFAIVTRLRGNKMRTQEREKNPRESLNSWFCSYNYNGCTITMNYYHAEAWELQECLVTRFTLRDFN